MLNISPGVLIAMCGIIGLTFTFAEGSGLIISKLPLVLFFLAIIVIGILYEAVPKTYLDDTYGNVGGGKDFG